MAFSARGGWKGGGLLAYKGVHDNDFCGCIFRSPSTPESTVATEPFSGRCFCHPSYVLCAISFLPLLGIWNTK